jgi:hypothetical protein
MKIKRSIILKIKISKVYKLLRNLYIIIILKFKIKILKIIVMTNPMFIKYNQNKLIRKHRMINSKLFLIQSRNYTYNIKKILQKLLNI